MNAFVPLKGFALRTMIIHIAEKAGLAFAAGIDEFTADDGRLPQLIKGVADRPIAIEADGDITFAQLGIDVTPPAFFITAERILTGLSL